MYIYIFTVSEIVGLASQFLLLKLSCLPYSKLNLGSKFHDEVATHLPHIKLKIQNTLNIVF